MGSKTFDGVWFLCYAHDHTPPHIHARHAGIEVILELRPDGTISFADRPDAITPRNAKRSDVRHIFRVADSHCEELLLLWEMMHGTK